MTAPLSRWRGVAVAFVATVAVGGCANATGSSDVGAEPGPSTSPASGSVPATPPRGSSAPVPPAPRVGSCYQLTFDQATAPTSDAAPVSCGSSHTTQTYYVGHLNTVVDGHLLAVDSRLAQRQVTQSCTRRFPRYVGGSAGTRALSRIRPVWFSPTIEQSDQGASWFRCDAVALEAEGTLAPLPTRLRGILDRSGALARVGLCGTAAPGTKGFKRVICSHPHDWRALSTIDIAGSSFPGVSAVRDAGEADCRSQVQQASGSPEKFSYGWEWPTAGQWRDGQHFGYCWAPD